MGNPQGPPSFLGTAQLLLLCLLCLLPLFQVARLSQVPREQPLWSLLKQYCHTMVSLDDPVGPYSYCNTTLDQIGTCWPRSAAGALVERPCPEYFNGIKYNTTRSAYRECLENGTWASKINYSQCEPVLDDKVFSPPPRTQNQWTEEGWAGCPDTGHRRPDHGHHRDGGLRSHTAPLQPRLSLFLAPNPSHVRALTPGDLSQLTQAHLASPRSIRCLRNVIHWNLVTTFILRNVTWFLLQLIDHEVHESNEIWCRCITTVFNYFVVTNFFWMFVEGCYLHTAIVMAYSTECLRKWIFLFVGWCVPCPIIVAWAIGKLCYEDEKCWFGKEPGNLVDYIYQGPIILVLLQPPPGPRPHHPPGAAETGKQEHSIMSNCSLFSSLPFAECIRI
ncbi:corticotropin-releasing factor receptor 2 isoform X9 [Fukomys damarensis]|uniref:corticotropin-releasing factor receptor 2 isoform X9 n=1 Tax=Fukomys damarensis TaxID=885580 RepID=UPI00053F76BF|nr:corticotropin-releasing factor receptor 2 isoform X9 [Fukomys damarensis]